MVIREFDVELPDGRTLHGYDTGEEGRDDRLTVVWHHGTPNIGTPPGPLFPAAERLGIRWMGYDRPSYGGSSPRPGRDVGSAAGDTAAIADAAGVDRFAVMGHSGGSMHALACAALLPRRVSAVVGVSDPGTVQCRWARLVRRDGAGRSGDASGSRRGARGKGAVRGLGAGG